MEKKPIVLNEAIGWKNKIALLLLVFIAPIGLTLLLTRSISHRRSVGYELLILFSVWINIYIWYLIVDALIALIIAMFFVGLPYVVYFFHIEEKKFYMTRSVGFSWVDILYAIFFSILSLQTSLLVMSKVTDVVEFQECSHNLQLATVGIILTITSLLLSCKYFSENSYVLNGFFEYVPDNEVSHFIFLIVCIVGVMAAPYAINDIPSVVYMLQCIIDGSIE